MHDDKDLRPVLRGRPRAGTRRGALGAADHPGSAGRTEAVHGSARRTAEDPHERARHPAEGARAGGHRHPPGPAQAVRGDRLRAHPVRRRPRPGGARAGPMGRAVARRTQAGRDRHGGDAGDGVAVHLRAGGRPRDVRVAVRRGGRARDRRRGDAGGGAGSTPGRGSHDRGLRAAEPVARPGNSTPRPPSRQASSAPTDPSRRWPVSPSSSASARRRLDRCSGRGSVSASWQPPRRRR